MTAPSNANTSWLDLVEHLELALVIANTSIRDQERRATAAEARVDRLAKGMPDLSSVIGWLASDCEPKHAVDELRIYQARIDAALQQETQP